MTYLNKKIKHTDFGEGVVVEERSSTAIMVQFEGGIKGLSVDNYKVFRKDPETGKALCEFVDLVEQAEIEALIARADEEKLEALRKEREALEAERIRRLEEQEKEEAERRILEEEERLRRQRIPSRINTMPMLVAGDYCGSQALAIYDDCCRQFGFKSSLRGNFAPQHLLCADNATSDGYAVWFLANNNRNGLEAARWRNIIKSDVEIIEEWNVAPTPEDMKEHVRVIFVKDSSGEYKFLGVFNCKFDVASNCRICTRFSNKYPV